MDTATTVQTQILAEIQARNENRRANLESSIEVDDRLQTLVNLYEEMRDRQTYTTSSTTAEAMNNASQESPSGAGTNETGCYNKRPVKGRNDERVTFRHDVIFTESERKPRASRQKKTNKRIVRFAGNGFPVSRYDCIEIASRRRNSLEISTAIASERSLKDDQSLRERKHTEELFIKMAEFFPDAGILGKCFDLEIANQYVILAQIHAGSVLKKANENLSILTDNEFV
mmetsp:Transcript_3020/g.4365  ORF Transcript_3020/g.4365 Transcript_3020/m.4365 type:complete len:229 (-) Transcript_3020:231-917(-)